jgi:hypothetical protein
MGKNVLTQPETSQKGLGFEILCKAKNCEYHEEDVSCKFQKLTDPVVLSEYGMCHNFKTKKGHEVSDHLIKSVKNALKYLKAKDNSEDFKEAKKILKEKGLNPDLVTADWLPVEDHINTFVVEALRKLAPIKSMLHDEEEDLLKEKLNEWELGGVIQVVDEVYKLLDVAADLHFRTH